MTSTEAAFAQGFPAYAGLTGGVPLCSFAAKGRMFVGCERTSRMQQMGNAMHVQSVAIAILFSITQIESEEAQSGAMSCLLSRVARRVRIHCPASGGA